MVMDAYVCGWAMQVGMAAMLAGVCQVPLTSVLLLFELTRDYRIILPLMGAVGLSSWIASSFTKKTKRSKSEKSEKFEKIDSPRPPISKPVLESSSALYPNQRLLSNGDGNGGVPKKAEDVYTKDGSSEEFVEEKGVCNIDESLCLANLEISEEQLAEEIPVSMAMRTRFAALSLDSTVREAMSVMELEKEWCVILLDSNRRLSGLITLADIQQAAGNAATVSMQMEVKAFITENRTLFHGVEINGYIISFMTAACIVAFCNSSFRAVMYFLKSVYCVVHR